MGKLAKMILNESIKATVGTTVSSVVSKIYDEIGDDIKDIIIAKSNLIKTIKIYYRISSHYDLSADYNMIYDQIKNNIPENIIVTDTLNTLNEIQIYCLFKLYKEIILKHVKKYQNDDIVHFDNINEYAKLSDGCYVHIYVNSRTDNDSNISIDKFGRDVTDDGITFIDDGWTETIDFSDPKVYIQIDYIGKNAEIERNKFIELFRHIKNDLKSNMYYLYASSVGSSIPSNANYSRNLGFLRLPPIEIYRNKDIKNCYDQLSDLFKTIYKSMKSNNIYCKKTKILLYGEHGTGKSSFANTLINTYNNIGISIDMVNVEFCNFEWRDEKNIRLFLNNIDSSAVFLINNLEKYFPTGFRDKHYDIFKELTKLTIGKGYGTLIIATTDDIDNVDPDVLNEFDYKYNIGNIDKEDAILYINDLEGDAEQVFSDLSPDKEGKYNPLQIQKCILRNRREQYHF